MKKIIAIVLMLSLMSALLTGYVSGEKTNAELKKAPGTYNYVFNGYNVTVQIPNNPNGKWIWKTEFFSAFDQAERALNKQGYTRVYYEISNMYGNDEAVELMHNFQDHLVSEYGLAEKAILFGFSRGALYAFNYTLKYPDAVDKIYLDAPVLNVKSWPPVNSGTHRDLLEKYEITEEEFSSFSNSPIDNLEKFFSYNIPLLVIAGASDTTVPLEENAGILFDYCLDKDVDLEYLVKPDCDHHPHSLTDVAPIVAFVNG